MNERLNQRIDYYYNMNHTNRGIASIFNHEWYRLDRSVTHTDSKNLRKIFTALNFDVRNKKYSSLCFFSICLSFFQAFLVDNYVWIKKNKNFTFQIVHGTRKIIALVARAVAYARSSARCVRLDGCLLGLRYVFKLCTKSIEMRCALKRDSSKLHVYCI